MINTDLTYDSEVCDFLIHSLAEFCLCAQLGNHVLSPVMLSTCPLNIKNEFSDWDTYVFQYNLTPIAIFQRFFIAIINYVVDEQIWNNAIRIKYNGIDAFVEQCGQDIIILIKNMADRSKEAECYNRIKTEIDKIQGEMNIPENAYRMLFEASIKRQAEEIEVKNDQSISKTVNNYYGPTSVNNAPAENIQMIVGNGNTITFTYEKAKEVMREIEQAIQSASLTSYDKDVALELLAEINGKIEQKKKPSIIKSALIGLKDFLINAGANLAVTQIVAKMQGLF